MAEFALRNQKTRQVQCLLATKFLYSGQAGISTRPAYDIADICNVSQRTVYRCFEWLLDRNWMGRDLAIGWLYFRGLDRIRIMERWKHTRAGILYHEDLKSIKAFCAGLVLSSLAKTGRGKRNERLRGGSVPSASPISLRAVAKVLNVSKSTAYRLRNEATQRNYIKCSQNLIRIQNLEALDMYRLRKLGIQHVTVKVSGFKHPISVATDRIRCANGEIFLQEANLIEPMISMKRR